MGEDPGLALLVELGAELVGHRGQHPPEMDSPGWLYGNLEGLVGPSSIHQSDDDTHTGWVVGGGIDKFDIEGFGAKYAYTVDGGELGEDALL